MNLLAFLFCYCYASPTLNAHNVQFSRHSTQIHFSVAVFFLFLLIVGSRFFIYVLISMCVCGFSQNFPILKKNVYCCGFFWWLFFNIAAIVVVVVIVDIFIFIQKCIHSTHKYDRWLLCFYVFIFDEGHTVTTQAPSIKLKK